MMIDSDIQYMIVDADTNFAHWKWNRPQRRPSYGILRGLGPVYMKLLKYSVTTQVYELQV